MITYADLAGRVGTSFAVDHVGGTATAVLTECRAHDGAHPGASFTATFRTSPQLPVVQGTYELRSDDFGPEAVFLVPVATVTDDPNVAAVFEAVFTTTSDTTTGGNT